MILNDMLISTKTRTENRAELDTVEHEKIVEPEMSDEDNNWVDVDIAPEVPVASTKLIGSLLSHISRRFM